MQHSNSTIYSCQTREKLSHFMAQRFVVLAKQCVKKRGSFHVAFSGGRSPQLFYVLLSQPPYCEKVPWRHVYIYQTDERFVSAYHVDNNFSMISRLLIKNLDLPPSQVFRIKTDGLIPQVAADDYERQLIAQLPKDQEMHPTFDFVLLGVGVDGHIASLFPDSNLLNVSDKLVMSSFVKSLQAWRISLTLKALRYSRTTAIVVFDKNKAKVVNTVFDPKAPVVYPVQMLKPIGRLEWYLDTTVTNCLTLPKHIE